MPGHKEAAVVRQSLHNWWRMWAFFSPWTDGPKWSNTLDLRVWFGRMDSRDLKCFLKWMTATPAADGCPAATAGLRLRSTTAGTAAKAGPMGNDPYAASVSPLQGL